MWTSEMLTRMTKRDNAHELGFGLFVVQLVFLVLAWIFTLLRFYVKVFMLKKVLIDDYLMGLAVLMYTGYASAVFYGVVNGAMGLHGDSPITIEGAIASLKGWYICEVVYPPILCIIRTSISIFLLRIANKSTHRIIIYVNLGVIWLLGIVYNFIVAFQCSPISYFWEQMIGKPGKCLPLNVVPDASIAYSLISGICDFVLALLPIWILWTVQLNKRTKVIVGTLLSTGFIAGVALIARIAYIKQIALSIEFLYGTLDLAKWTLVEPSLGIIAGCAATLRPLFKAWGVGPASSRRYMPGKLSGSGSGSGGWRRFGHAQNQGSLEPAVPVHMSFKSDSSSSYPDRKPMASDIELIRPGNEALGATAASVSSGGHPESADFGGGYGPVEGWRSPKSVVHVQRTVDVISDRTDRAS